MRESECVCESVSVGVCVCGGGGVYVCVCAVFTAGTRGLDIVRPG